MPPWKIAECRGFRTCGRRRSPMTWPTLCSQNLDDKGGKPNGMPGQGERGIWHSPSGARIAWFKDPHGNVLSLTGLREPQERDEQKSRTKAS